MRPRLAALLLFSAAATFAQKLNPVQWSMMIDPGAIAPGATATARLTAKMDGEWHIYSMTTPEGGPMATSIRADANPAIADVKLYQPAPIVKFDPNFNLDAEMYGREVAFLAVFDVAKSAPSGPSDLTLNIRYQACTEKECLPRRATVTARFSVDAKAKAAAAAIPAGYTEYTGRRTVAAARPTP